ncbi:hypothetical protein [Actinoplanes sp. NPDC023714]|uniref:hypothetical protein n=1 Tax=Actinoplanes sp. NPDC023714 TaxID=3154322 RepID=UPI00340BB654
MTSPRSTGHVDLYWLPLGAGGPWPVRRAGRLYRAVTGYELYHSALRVRADDRTYTVEMAPVWGNAADGRGVVAEGPVGLRLLGHSRLFRYEVRCWRDGRIPDLAYAVASPQNLAVDAERTERLLRLLPDFPCATWGRDEQGTGDMWNSNSLIAWALSASGHPVHAVRLPPHGRAPGWAAGLRVAAQQLPVRSSSAGPA